MASGDVLDFGELTRGDRQSARPTTSIATIAKVWQVRFEKSELRSAAPFNCEVDFLARKALRYPIALTRRSSA